MPFFLLYSNTPEVSLLLESFEYSTGWPDTIPDSLINPNLDFGAAESSLSDSFETVDAWP